MGNFIIVEDGSNSIGPVHNPSEFTEFEIEKPKAELPKSAQDVKSTMDVPPVIVDNPPKQDLKTRDDIIKDDGIISSIDNDGPLVSVPSSDPVVISPVSSVGSPDAVFDPSIIYEFAEVEPQFPGDLSKFLGDRAKFPEFESSQGIEKGYVLVGFVVNEDGSISDIKLLKADRENFNNQALKAVRAMPKWKPGSNDGHEVKVRLEIPFNFVDQ